MQAEVFSNVDFSHRDFHRERFEACSFTDVNFSHADMSEIADRGNTFERCSFDHANFANSFLGRGESKYIACRFDDVWFRGCIFSRPEFDDCLFRNCDLKGVDFDASSFVGCRFEGKVEDVWFRGGYAIENDVEDFGVPRKNEMRNVDFSKAQLIRPTFSGGVDLSTVKLPETADYRFFDRWPRRLTNARKVIDKWEEPARKEALDLVNDLMVHAIRQDTTIRPRADLAEWIGVELADRFLAALESLE